MNHVGLVGRFTKDPVLRYLSGNRVQTHFSLAINRNYKNSRGEIDTDFIFCTAWGRLAEHIVKYCGKGSLVGANGRIQSRSFMNEESTKIFMTEVVVEDVRFYQLKPRDSDGAIAVSQPPNEQEELKDFVLPGT
ncbi:single-stranded DNA-binding protein [Lysinibacillus sp. FSL K6-0232]|uniref:single-stranded DNA-binding protein n=1 Tax=unclassified Lysinibacillus TaxID=2636778 RepID=UPI0030F911AF